MKALSWKEPYGSLMLHGKIETRTWHTYVRGPVLICCSKKDYDTQQILNISGMHQLLYEISIYLQDNLKLEVKDNYQVFPVEARGIDFVGYVFYHTHIRLRKTIKKRFARMISRGGAPASIASYNGWAKHCDSKHLLKKLLPCL